MNDPKEIGPGEIRPGAIQAIAITVNGTLREVQTPCSLHAFLVQHDVNPLLVAVEYNGDIVRPERFDEIALQTGDQLEIVHMVGGGA